MGGLIQEVTATTTTSSSTTTSTSSSSSTSTTANNDPAPSYLFFVEISGVTVGLFTECSGIAATRDIEPYAEGGVNNYVYNLPGRVHYDNIVLKRGLGINRALWDWFPGRGK